MTSNEQTILDKVKKTLKIKTEQYDDILLNYIQIFEDKIKSICKRCDFPCQLNYLCVQFAVNSYAYYKDKDLTTANEQTNVTKATDNGQSVDFKTTEIVSKDDVDINSFADKNMAEISNYAFMGW
ncbi:MAG: phage head-tail connector protein [Lachnospiraceae bacterium]|nr:phage head-tail connector protein [Lachnospiraceae bacterium]